MKHSEKRNRQKSSEGDEENRNLANTPDRSSRSGNWYPGRRRFTLNLRSSGDSPSFRRTSNELTTTGRSDQYDRRPSSRNLDRLSIESKRFTVNFSIYFNLTDFYPFFFEDYDRRPPSSEQRNLDRLSIEGKC
jgi:hypothetical protein